MQVVKVDRNGRLSRPLDTLEAACSSSKEFIIKGIPAGTESVTVRLGRGDTGALSSVAASPRPDGTWGVYASPLYFPAAGDADWHLTGRDRHGNNLYLGKGRLKIVESVLDDGGEPELIPSDTFVRNPVTGLWHRLTAVIEDGVIVPIVEAEGVAR